jgi:hypothetical protein
VASSSVLVIRGPESGPDLRYIYISGVSAVDHYRLPHNGGDSSGVLLPTVAFLAGMMHVVAALAAAGLEYGFPARAVPSGVLAAAGMDRHDG